MALKAAVREAHRPELLDRHHAEQAAVEDRLRARQARWPDPAVPRRHCGADLAAGRAQGQRHRPEGGGEAVGARHRDDRRCRRRRAGVPDRALRQELRRLDARRRARPRRAAGGDGERAGIDQPGDDLRPRPACGARPRRARRDLHRPVHEARRRPVEEGLCREDHRHQAALRRFPDRHPRPHPAGAHPRRPRDPARRRPVPEARRPRPAAAPARRARLGAAQGERPAESVCAGPSPPALSRGAGDGAGPAAVRDESTFRPLPLRGRGPG